LRGAHPAREVSTTMNARKRTASAAHHPQAYVSNGLIGLRMGASPFEGATTLVCGFVGRSEQAGHEALVPAPYPLGVEVILDRTSMRRRPDLVRFVEQSYDFASGELTTRLEFKVGSVTAQIEVLTFCARSIPVLALQQTRIN